MERVGVPDAFDPLRGVHRLLVQPPLRAMAMLSTLREKATANSSRGHLSGSGSGSEAGSRGRLGGSWAFSGVPTRALTSLAPYEG